MSTSSVWTDLKETWLVLNTSVPKIKDGYIYQELVYISSLQDRVLNANKDYRKRFPKSSAQKKSP